MSKFFLLFLMAVFLLSGCSIDKEKVINEMLPEEGKGKHSLYVFSEFMSAQVKDNLSKDLLKFVNAEETQKKLDIRKTQFVDVEYAKDYVKALNIKKLPLFVLLNKEGIVLQTNDINQVLNYVHEK